MQDQLDSLLIALNVVPGNASLRLTICDLFIQKNEKEKAIKLLEEGLEIADDDSLKQKLVQLQQERPRLSVISGNKVEMDDDDLERPSVTFKDVGGLEDLKEQIRMNIIYPFQNPFLFKQYGKKVGGGILLYGPPGCGKTFVARATAGECKANFISISITDILNEFIGNSERNLHDLFELARRKAPTVLFIDEVDALGGKRSAQNHWAKSLTNQLLVELDGINSNNEEVLILATTNTPWDVDTALKRPGRFDRVIFVRPPDLEARKQILEIHLQNRPHDKIDLDKVAKKMEHFSGADIEAVCDQAAEIALMEALRTNQIRPITTADLLQVLKKVKPSTMEWLASAKNYATYSNESGFYDDILEYFKGRK